MDIFAMNQHRSADTQFGSLLTTLREVVADADKTLMVLDGWVGIGWVGIAVCRQTHSGFILYIGTYQS